MDVPLKTSEDSLNMPQAITFIQHLREHANRYFADFGGSEVSVKLVSQQNRLASMVYRFDLSVAGLHRYVLVKVSVLRGRRAMSRGGEGGSARERPHLAALTDPEIKFQLEWTALSAIYDYFASLNDPRFGAIRVLDALPEYRAIVMEEVRYPSLREVFLKASRLTLTWRSVKLDAAFHNAGAWLRAYHALPKREHVQTRHAQRADFVELISEFTAFLAKELGDEPFWSRIAATSGSSAFDTLPESLPTGLGHGDYAMRNILVAPGDRVIVLDTLAKWRTPIYEDIAYFLTQLKTTWPQMLSQGLMYSSDRLARYEHEFLIGYFGQEPIPLRIIRLYEIQALLDRWASWVIHGNQRDTRVHGMTRTVRFALLQRCFRKHINRLLLEAGSRERR